jgi:hypothetical protein
MCVVARKQKINNEECSLRTDVSEEYIASIFRVKNSEPSTSICSEDYTSWRSGNRESFIIVKQNPQNTHESY